jgi:hypothetical protein
LFAIYIKGILKMQAQEGFAGNKNIWSVPSALMARTSPIAQRLKILRIAMGYGGHGGQTGFARFLGLGSPQRWNNVEKGLPLGKDLALLLVRRCPGLSLGWLYSGIRTELSVGIGSHGSLSGSQVQFVRQ